jgi:hypothetical protein
VPNLNANRLIGMGRAGSRVDVRRLMYQALIWGAVLSDDTGGLRASLDAEGLERLADALVHRVRRDIELSRDFFRRQVLVHEAQTIELAGA